MYKPTQESKARGIFSQVFRCMTEIIKEIRQNSSLVTPTNHPLQKPGKGCRSEVQPTKFGNNWKIITGNNLGIIFLFVCFCELSWQFKLATVKEFWKHTFRASAVRQKECHLLWGRACSLPFVTKQYPGFIASLKNDFICDSPFKRPKSGTK